MAGFLDRAKDKAQQGMTVGKQKVEEVQAKRTAHDLQRRLGAAYYAEQRGSGTADEVARALAALDEHVREHGDAVLGD